MLISLFILFPLQVGDYGTQTESEALTRTAKFLHISSSANISHVSPVLSLVLAAMGGAQCLWYQPEIFKEEEKEAVHPEILIFFLSEKQAK